MDRNDSKLDIMHQTRGLINAILEVYKKMEIGQFIIIDKTMVRYKDGYCLARQNMPKKSIEVWCAINANSKCIYDFDV